MKKTVLAFAVFITTLNSFAQTNDVVDIAISSKDHTTLVAAVKAADLVATLKVKDHSPYLHLPTRPSAIC